MSLVETNAYAQMMRERIDAQTERNKAGLPIDSSNPTTSDCASLQLAIGGYMADRHALVELADGLNMHYEHGQKKGAFITQELARIDKAVAELLAPLN